jgi:signal transduction histidine kinase
MVVHEFRVVQDTAMTARPPDAWSQPARARFGPANLFRWVCETSLATRILLLLVIVVFPSIGIQGRAEAFASIDSATLRGVSLVLFGFLLAIYAAYQCGRIFIRRPIDRLLRTTAEWSQGNYAARVELEETGSEIGRLGVALNDMAAAVAALYAAQKEAEAELRRRNRTLEERVEQRTRELAAANRALAAARDDAESANTAKTVFLATMSHELRTPLNAIVGFSDLIVQEVFGPVERKYLEFSTGIRAAGERMSMVIDDILMVAQLEAGTFTLNWDEIDLCNAVSETLDAYVGLQPARADDVGFETMVEALPIRADRHALQQMIVKLLSNASKFSDKGTPIDLSVGVTADGMARLSVHDKGIGMTAEEVENAVKPFRQIDQRLERKYQGSGLGLSIVHQLVERHGGHLEIVSVPHEGTVASLYFPTASAKRRRRT